MPAFRRSEEFKKDTPAPEPPGKPPRRKLKHLGPDAKPGTPEHKAQVIHGMITAMGMKRQTAEKMYEKQLADWKAAQSGQK